MQHLDLLFGARRLWKLRLESCRLVDLEHRILGVERQGDLPGEMIPYVYFDFLRSQKAFQVVPIFHHNALDILSLACLTAIVPFAFRSPDDAAVRPRRRPASAWRAGCCRPNVRRKRSASSAAPWRWACPTICSSARCGMSRSSSAGGPRRRRARHGHRARRRRAIPIACAPSQELAKHYEHREKNYAMALEMTRSALAIEDTPEIRRREHRLKTRIAIRFRA